MAQSFIQAGFEADLLHVNRLVEKPSLFDGLAEGEDVDKVEPQVMEIVRGHFRPEFLNRLDEIILFRRLQRPAAARSCLRDSEGWPAAKALRANAGV